MIDKNVCSFMFFSVKPSASQVSDLNFFNDD